MSTSIVILSPLSDTAIQKAVAACITRSAEVNVSPPEMEVVSEFPDMDMTMITGMIDDEDIELQEQLLLVQSGIVVTHPSTLSKDPAFVECLRFLLRRVGDGLVKFPDGVAGVHSAEMLIASLAGIDAFDERQERRHLQARLMNIKYRLLSELWKRDSSDWKPRAISNLEIEEFERGARFQLPPEFRGYLAIVGVGPGPGVTGLLPLDELGKAKTYAKAAGRPKLGKAIAIGSLHSNHQYLLVCDGEVAGTVWEVTDGELSREPLAADFLEHIEAWIGAGEPDEMLCNSCGVVLDGKDLEREYCRGCGARRAVDEEERSEASRAFEALAGGLIEQLVIAELLELENESMLRPLIVGLMEYMSEKGHKWKSPDRAAASIAGWLLHRDEVAELHGTNSDVARVFARVAKS